MLTRAVS
jgi:hypothetical protein